MNTKKREGESEAVFFLKNVLGAGVSACFAEACTIPIDSAKVRLQVQQVVEGQQPKYKGLIGTVKTVSAEEGVTALWYGLTPGCQRQLINCGLRIGLYVPVRDAVCGPLAEGQNPLLYQKVIAGLITGAIGISVANPTDVVKIRLQAQGSLKPSERRYSGTMDCYRKIIAADGIPGLWVGIIPNIMRNSIINAAEIASYDQYKQTCLQTLKMKDNLATHFLCGFSAGFTATCIGSPLDVMKTRIMNASGGQVYNGFLDCFVKIMKNEGPAAFYKGFVPNFMRIGFWNILFFVTYEQVKAQMFG